jgi:hypothetical protein
MLTECSIMYVIRCWTSFKFGRAHLVCTLKERKIPSITPNIPIMNSNKVRQYTPNIIEREQQLRVMYQCIMLSVSTTYLSMMV